MSSRTAKLARGDERYYRNVPPNSEFAFEIVPTKSVRDVYVRQFGPTTAVGETARTIYIVQTSRNRPHGRYGFRRLTACRRTE